MGHRGFITLFCVLLYTFEISHANVQSLGRINEASAFRKKSLRARWAIGHEVLI